MTKKLLLTLALPAVIVASAGTAIAASSNDPAVIKGCVDKKGALRVANTCKKGETALAWNTKGPAGPAGAAGPQGPAGASGGVVTNVGGDALEGGKAAVSATLDGVASEIAVKSFAINAKNTPSGAGGGGAGKVEFGNVRFAKLYDASSPKLLLRTATGQHLATATFTFKEASAVTTYKLTDVTVIDYEQGGDKDRPMLEHVELNFAKVEVSHQPATGAAVTAGWDLKLNQSI